MSRSSLGLPDDLQQYLVEHSVRETDSERQLRLDTADHPSRHMQIAPEQAQMMKVLAKMVDARLALEVGVFTGYSAMAVAEALPPDGRLIACEIDEEYGAAAKQNWRNAGLDEKIDLRLGPAVDTLNALIEEGYQGRFDFAFIDADKNLYPDYYESTLKLLRQGGVVLIDNIFRRGDISDLSMDDEALRGTRALNSLIKSDERVDPCIIPIADGVTIARKR